MKIFSKKSNYIKKTVSLTVALMLLLLPIGPDFSLQIAEAYVTASGGDSVYEIVDGGTTYKVHEFTTSGTLTVSAGGEVEYLIVGGGGGGGRARGGGGGGGGMLTGTTTITSGSKTITVGTGGAGASTDAPGDNGNDSSAFSITADGGGGGGSYGGNGTNSGLYGHGGDGGSGGGGAGPNGSAGQGTAGQGNDGDWGGAFGGYGGGGAGEAANDDKDGNDGSQSDITGTNTYYAGGGGGAFNSSGGPGGLGGGGDGFTDDGSQHGTDGLGGGGGGVDFEQSPHEGGDGGDGIVIVRYEVEPPANTGFGEAGTITTVADGTWTTLNFNRSYENPIVIGTTNTDNNGNGLIFESRNVTETSAEVRICKSLGSSGTGCDPAATSNETAGYLVLAPNRLNQSDLSGVSAGYLSLSGGESSAQAVSFDKSFSQAPYIFASVQTNNGDDGVEAKIDSVTTSGFNISLCEPNGDTCDTTHVAETVAWVAIEPGSIPWSQTSEVGTENTSGDIWNSFSFTESYSSAPVVLAKQQTENGGQDGEISEARSVTTSGADVRFCELDASGVCDGHIAEDVAWMAVAVGELSSGRPAVETDPVSNISTSTVTVNGNIISTGSSGTVTERGFVGGTSSQENPGNVAPGSSAYSFSVGDTGTFGTGTFSKSFSGLSPVTVYYLRAYAGTSLGYGYGDEVSFITDTTGEGIILTGISTQLRGGTTIRGGTIIR